MDQRWSGDTWVEGPVSCPCPGGPASSSIALSPSAQWPVSHCLLSSLASFSAPSSSCPWACACMCVHVISVATHQRHSGLWIHLRSSFSHPVVTLSLFLSLSISHLPHLFFMVSFCRFHSVSSFFFYFQLLTLLISVTLFFKVIFPYCLSHHLFMFSFLIKFTLLSLLSLTVFHSTSPLPPTPCLSFLSLSITHPSHPYFSLFSMASLSSPLYVILFFSLIHCSLSSSLSLVFSGSVSICHHLPCFVFSSVPTPTLSLTTSMCSSHSPSSSPCVTPHLFPPHPPSVQPSLSPHPILYPVTPSAFSPRLFLARRLLRFPQALQASLFLPPLACGTNCPSKLLLRFLHVSHLSESPCYALVPWLPSACCLLRDFVPLCLLKRTPLLGSFPAIFAISACEQHTRPWAGGTGQRVKGRGRG